MATQIKIGAALCTLATGAWISHVNSVRSNLPQGRRRKFSPGSSDDIMSENLNSGDLVLFSRRCELYYVCEGGGGLGEPPAALTHL